MNYIIDKYWIRWKKSLWQNFLIDEDILSKISLITNIQNENIIEVWPWYWALTQKILNLQPKSLSLVELDNNMIKILKDRIKNNDFFLQNIDLIIYSIDVLDFETNLDNYTIIANIPYYITSPILRKFLYTIKNKPKKMIILMQKDVWEKILSKKSSVLSLIVQKKSLIKKELDVYNYSFYPKPKVDSIVLSFKLIDYYDKIPDWQFLQFIKKCFLSPRKKLVNNLIMSWYIKEDIIKTFKVLNFDINLRPEDLFLEDYLKLLNQI